MKDIEFVLSAFASLGKDLALKVQSESSEMDGTELNRVSDSVPFFQNAKTNKNMLEREVGFVCRSSAGRVVKLLQKYDSSIYEQEPEELPAQWGFVWSTNPQDAKPFIALSTSPYGKKETCTSGGYVWASKIDNNVFNPVDYEQGWENLGTVEQWRTV